MTVIPFLSFNWSISEPFSWLNPHRQNFLVRNLNFILYQISRTLRKKTLRYFFHIGYNGYNYRGWQKLPQSKSVQFIIEALLSQILKTNVTIVGCGRTDAQVHASQFFFHADIEEAWDYDLMFRLNKNLPGDIAIFEIIPMQGLPHARFDAIERTYNYFIHTYKDPFLSTISSLYLGKHLNLEEMKKAVTLLPRYNDYLPFCKNASAQRTTICKVTSANLYVDDSGDNIRFEISANRFLSGMIRIIMQKLLLIGRGELSVDEFENHLISKETPKDIKGAYPQGLYLSQVKYPFLELPSRSQLFNSLAQENRWKVV
jgi:tRNA pseudouridine38-40 synthase